MILGDTKSRIVIEFTESRGLNIYSNPSNLAKCVQESLNKTPGVTFTTDEKSIVEFNSDGSVFIFISPKEVAHYLHTLFWWRCGMNDVPEILDHNFQINIGEEKLIIVDAVELNWTGDNTPLGEVKSHMKTFNKFKRILG